MKLRSGRKVRFVLVPALALHPVQHFSPRAAVSSSPIGSALHPVHDVFVVLSKVVCSRTKQTGVEQDVIVVAESVRPRADA